MSEMLVSDFGKKDSGSVKLQRTTMIDILSVYKCLQVNQEVERLCIVHSIHTMWRQQNGDKTSKDRIIIKLTRLANRTMKKDNHRRNLR